jgi:hypothetical protein
VEHGDRILWEVWIFTTTSFCLTLCRKSNIFLLLTGGGSRELDSLAYNIVIEEDHERKEKGSRSLADLSSSSGQRGGGDSRGAREEMEFLSFGEED